jgi:hydrogenase nickel incorporation protein HypA/HybF
MHELSLTQNVVEICEQNAGGRRVTAVVLEIGALSGVEPDAMAFCFDACTKETLLDGARLVIERVEARALCEECRGEFAPLAYFDPCPACGGFRVRIVAGEELRVKELEVE